MVDTIGETDDRETKSIFIKRDRPGDKEYNWRGSSLRSLSHTPLAEIENHSSSDENDDFVKHIPMDRSHVRTEFPKEVEYDFTSDLFSIFEDPKNHDEEIVKKWPTRPINRKTIEKLVLLKRYKNENVSLQKNTLYEGRRLNRMCKEIDKSFEEVIIGHSNKASGIIVHKLVRHPIARKSKLYVLLVRENGVVNIPGGKSQGEETPIDTAIREFREEVTQPAEKKEISTEIKEEDRIPIYRLNEQKIVDNVIESFHLPSDGYTLFFLEMDKYLLSKIPIDFILKKHFVPVEEDESVGLWIDYDDIRLDGEENINDVSKQLSSFTNSILRRKNMINWANNLLNIETT